jgi:hypothetical protein
LRKSTSNHRHPFSHCRMHFHYRVHPTYPVIYTTPA